MFFVFATMASAAVFVVQTCPQINAAALESVRTRLDVDVHAIDRRLMAMEAWAAARLSVAPEPTDRRRAVVYVSCRSMTVGLTFEQFTPGMDCGQQLVEHAFAGVDALDPADALTVKLERLLASLDDWHDQQLCTTGTERQRAVAFWLIVGLCALLWRRWGWRTTTAPAARAR